PPLSATDGSVVVLKVDPAGNLVASAVLAETSSGESASGEAVAVGPSGEVFVVGEFSGVLDLDPSPGAFALVGAAGVNQVFAVQLDSNLQFVRGGQFGAPDSGVSGAAADPAGGVWVTGSTNTAS